METVLIISPNMSESTELEMLFKQKGYAAITENNSLNAVQSARLFAPALIIMDIDMPAAEKIGLCRNLRKITSGAILMLVGSHESPGLYQFFDAGADEYIRKPVTRMAIIVKSVAWLARQEIPTVGFSQPIRLHV